MVPEISRRIKAFSLLGEQLMLIAKAIGQQNPGILDSKASLQMYEKALDSPNQNPWFTTANVSQAIKALGQMLDKKKLEQWWEQYEPFETHSSHSPKTVAVVMAGNLPLVGFHDFLCVLISGHKILAKLSSQDKYLPCAAGDLLVEIEPGFANALKFTETTISGFDAVIATGSNNSSRYFEYYFGKYPHIIRRNRNALSILTGQETIAQLEELGQDVFSYYGLGCRNVSAIFIPSDFNISLFQEAWKSYSHVVDNHKYGNNYDYQKAILMINKIPFIDTGFCLLREESTIGSPVSVVHLLKYNDLSEVEEFLLNHNDQVQCITSGRELKIKTADSIPLGKSQQPELWDYADNVDTLKFLLGLYR